MARAIEDTGQAGLPMLVECVAVFLSHVTRVGAGALTFAVVKNCPRLNTLMLLPNIVDEEMAKGVIWAAGADTACASTSRS